MVTRDRRSSSSGLSTTYPARRTRRIQCAFRLERFERGLLRARKRTFESMTRVVSYQRPSGSAGRRAASPVDSQASKEVTPCGSLMCSANSSMVYSTAISSAFLRVDAMATICDSNVSGISSGSSSVSCYASWNGLFRVNVRVGCVFGTYEGGFFGQLLRGRHNILFRAKNELCAP